MEAKDQYGMFSDYSIFKVLFLDIKYFRNTIFNGSYIDNCIKLKRIF